MAAARGPAPRTASGRALPATGRRGFQDCQPQTLALAPTDLPQIVLLPSADADLIDEVIAGCLQREPSAPEKRPPGATANQGAPSGAADTEQERQKHESAVSILLDAVADSQGHTWHFLNSLGKALGEAREVDGALRALLLLHGYLRTATREKFQELVRTLLGSNQGGKQATEHTNGKPQLDLLGISHSFHVTTPQPEPSPQGQAPPCPTTEGAVTAVRAYSKYLLQRIASSRFVFLPVSAHQAPGGPGATQGGTPNNGGTKAEWELREGYWAQQGASELMQQLQALQRLQDGLVACGTACIRWLQQLPPDGSPVTPLWMPAAMRVMGVALEALLKDSFALFSAINYGLIELIERIGRIPKEQGMQALQVCQTSSSQGQALSDLYLMLGSLSVGRNVEFPAVAVMDEGYLHTLQQFVEDRGGQTSGKSPAFKAPPAAQPTAPVAVPPATPQPTPVPQQPSYAQLAAAYQFEETTQALFGRYAPPPTPLPPLPTPMLALPAPGGSPAYQGQQGMLALPAPAGAGSGQAGYGVSALGPGAVYSSASSEIVPYQVNSVKAAWEVALDSTLGPSASLPGPTSSSASSSILQCSPLTQFTGGFDQLLLDSLYEAAQAQRRASEAAAQAQRQPYGNVAAAYVSKGRDPFAASGTVPPPPYVQMAMRAQEQMAVEMQRRMMSRHAEFSASLRSAWNTDGRGVKYGANVVVPF